MGIGSLRLFDLVKLGRFHGKKLRRVGFFHALDRHLEGEEDGDLLLFTNRKNTSPTTCSSTTGTCDVSARPLPKGCVAVYVGEDMRRCVIPVMYLSSPEFVTVLEMMEEEFGFEHTGGLRIPCDVDEFEKVVGDIKKSRLPFYMD